MIIKMTKKYRLWLIIYIFLLIIGAFFSWGLVVPNLIFNQSEFWLNWQWWQWGLWNKHREIMAVSFLIWAVMIFISYLQLISHFPTFSKNNSSSPSFPRKLSLTNQKKTISLFYPFSNQRHQSDKKSLYYPWRYILFSLFLLIIPLLFAYNAFSADIFNYIFNAKMVTVYQTNPHLVPATTFTEDPMISFMHNSHTTAPYGYIWTALTVPLYLLSFGKFSLAWLIFKFSALVSLLLTVWLVTWLFSETRPSSSSSPIPLDLKPLALLFFNPLFLLEILMNNHNDLWMMAGALASLGLITIYRQRPRRSIFLVILSGIFLALSIGIKYSSLVVLPFWLYLLCGPEIIRSLRWPWLASFSSWLEKHFFDLIVLAFFLLLLLPRTQFFHPWYLLWALVWLPFCRWRWTKTALIAFSFSSFLRYLPWLWAGNYAGSVLLYQQLITWVGAGIILIVVFIKEKLLKYSHARS